MSRRKGNEQMCADSGAVIIGVVGINATVIGIVIGALTGIIFYVRSIINNAEMMVVQEAEKINKVTFARSAYFPVGFLLPWGRNVIKSIQGERMGINAAPKAIEPRASRVEIPFSTTQIKELFRYLDFLAFPLHATDESEGEGEYDLGNDKYIPRDLANRGEEILIVLNLITQSDIFPESPFPTRRAYKKGALRRVSLPDATEAEDWLLKVEEFVEGTKKYRAMQSSYPGSIFIENLKTRDKALIELWEDKPICKASGHLDPEFLLSDFQANAEKVAKVAEATRYAINKYKRVSSRFPLPFMYFFMLLFFVVFLSGVVAPLIIPSISKSIYLYFPLVSYSLLYLGIIWWIWQDKISSFFRQSAWLSRIGCLVCGCGR